MVESTYPVHIRRIKERCEVIEEEKSERGKTILIRAIADTNQIRLFKEKEATVSTPMITRSLVKSINERATSRGMDGRLVKEELISVTERFKGGCALTGEASYSFDHVVPISIGRSGSIYENIIPLRSDLNSSKHIRNIFDWFADNRERFGLEQRRFDELITYLADINDMTTQEYEEYVRWCHDNPRDLTKEDDDATA